MLKERTIDIAVAEKKTDLNAIKTQNKHTEFACCYESENTNGAYTSDDKAQWEKGARGRGERRCFRPLVSTGVSGLRSIRGKDKAMQKKVLLQNNNRRGKYRCGTPIRKGGECGAPAKKRQWNKGNETGQRCVPFGDRTKIARSQKCSHARARRYEGLYTHTIIV